MPWNREYFDDLVDLLANGSNPYQPIIDELEIALDYGRRALHSTANVPHTKGGGDIASAASSAITLLEEALAEAQQWRDALDHHINSGDRAHRTDL